MAYGHAAFPGKRRRLFRLQRGLCYWCMEPLHHPDKGTLDHLIPISLNGPDGNWNLVLACGPCNVSRSAPKIGRRRSSHIDEDGAVVAIADGSSIVVHDCLDPRLEEVAVGWHAAERSRFDKFKGLRRVPDWNMPKLTEVNHPAHTRKLFFEQWHHELGARATRRLWEENEVGKKKRKGHIRERFHNAARLRMRLAKRDETFQWKDQTNIPTLSWKRWRLREGEQLVIELGSRTAASMLAENSDDRSTRRKKLKHRAGVALAKRYGHEGKVLKPD